MRKNIIKFIALLLLIAAASGVLLYIDREDRTDFTRYNVATIQFSDDRHGNEVLAGLEDGLKEQGFVFEKNLHISKFNAGKNQTSAAEACALILRKEFDMVMTIGNKPMEEFRQKNEKKKLIHVFGMLDGDGLSPGQAVDITNDNAWMAGFSSFFPLDKMIELVRTFNPEVNTIGIIQYGNNHEPPLNVRKSKIEGIKTIRIAIDNNNDLVKAATKMIDAKVDAIIVQSGDSQLPDFHAMTGAAASAGIPVFGRNMYELKNGALACLETNYFSIGRLQGLIAGEILLGQKTENIPYRNIIPLNLLVNSVAAQQFAKKWIPTPELCGKATTVINENGTQQNPNVSRNQERDLCPQTKQAQKIKKSLLFVNYNEATSIDENMNGFLAGMERGGYRMGENYEMKIVNINENLTEAINIFRNAKNSSVDAILLTSTPLLENCIKVIKEKPVVFAVVAEPDLVSPGEDLQKKHANITGVSSMSDFAGMAALIRQCIPAATRVGTLYDPSEKNSVRCRDLFAEALKEERLELVSEPSRSAVDVISAADRLARHGIDVLCQISDNLHNRTFSGISNIGYMNRVPVFTFVKTNALQHGAIVALAYNYEDGGRQQAIAAIKVMQGVPPATIPIMQSPKSAIIINTINARRCGVKIPQSLIDQADMVIE